MNCSALVCCLMMLAQAPRSDPTTETVHALDITTKYDRVNDDTVMAVEMGTVVRILDGDIDTDLRFYWSWNGREREPAKNSDEITIYFISTSDTWEYLKTNGLAILADAFRIKPATKHEGKIKSGYIMESIAASVRFDDLKRISEADSVEFSLGIHEFRLNPQQVSALRDFVSRLAVSSEDADKIDGEHLRLVRKRQMEMQEAMDISVDKGRQAAKKLPKSRGATERNKLGLTKMLEEFTPTAIRYKPTPEETRELLSKYPEFNSSVPPVRSRRP